MARGLFFFPPELLPLPFRERLVNHVHGASGIPIRNSTQRLMRTMGRMKKRPRFAAKHQKELKIISGQVLQESTCSTRQIASLQLDARQKKM